MSAHPFTPRHRLPKGRWIDAPKLVLRPRRLLYFHGKKKKENLFSSFFISLHKRVGFRFKKKNMILSSMIKVFVRNSGGGGNRCLEKIVFFFPLNWDGKAFLFFFPPGWGQKPLLFKENMVVFFFWLGKECFFTNTTHKKCASFWGGLSFDCQKRKKKKNAFSFPCFFFHFSLDKNVVAFFLAKQFQFEKSGFHCHMKRKHFIFSTKKLVLI